MRYSSEDTGEILLEYDGDGPKEVRYGRYRTAVAVGRMVSTSEVRAAEAAMEGL